MAYNDMISRNAGGVSPDPLQVPEKVSRDILEEAETKSAIMQLARKERMSSRTERMPAIDMFPTAFWLGDNNTTAAQEDVAFKQTTTMKWKNITMEAREIAVMVPVPDNYVADSGFDLLAVIRPKLAEAIAGQLDRACFFNYQNPWKNNPYSVGIYQQAVAAGNTQTYVPATDDVYAKIAKLGQQQAEQGFNLGGAATRPGFRWLLAQDRTASTGVSPYNPNGAAGTLPDLGFGLNMAEVNNNSWDSTRAHAIFGDYSKALLGIRQDLTMKIFDSGVIQDPSDGHITYNPVQQDGKILRVVARFAFAVLSYKTIMHQGGDAVPFSVLRPSGAPAT